jgi:lysophospholipase L1-like esterase
MSWTSSKVRHMAGSWGEWSDMNARNVTRLHEAEKKGPLDFVLYGDSITSFHFGYSIGHTKGTDTLWKKYFGDLNAVPMGIPGDQIGNVLWRLSSGNEKPASPPKVIGFLIGINDCNRFGEDKSKPRVPSNRERMEALLNWVYAAFPTTAIVVCALTPTTSAGLADRNALNVEYQNLVRALAAKGAKITYADCSASFTKSDGTPTDPSYMGDKVHMSARGQEVFLQNLRATVNDMIKGNTTTHRSSTLLLVAVLVLFICSMMCGSMCSLILSVS